MLLTSGDSILDIAVSCGFQSHEVFCRAFRRRFGINPGAYRRRGFAHRPNPAQRIRYAFARYLQWGPGLVTLEAGFPVVAPASPAGQSAAATPSGIVADALFGGLVAVTTHTGPYENLREAHAAIEQWIEAQGLLPAGAPWEHYVTDPAEHPDPKDWKTDVYWPVRVP